MDSEESSSKNRLNELSELETALSPLISIERGEETRTLEERVDEMYEELGGCGCFQVLAYLAIGCGMSAVSWFVYETGFLT